MHSPPPLRSRARGYNLIELMVAISVAVFLLAGIIMIEQGTKQTSVAQTGLAQLQDEERIAMTILSNVVQQAGYYPIPAAGIDKHQLEIALPAIGAMIAGQAVYGEKDEQGNDKLTIRFLTDPNEDVLNCQGSGNPTAAQKEFDNEFSVDSDKHQLVCKVNNGPAVALVNNVESFTVQYGVFTRTATAFDNGGSVDAYIGADQFILDPNSSPTYWTNVYTVKVTIVFTNPLKGQAGQEGQDTITFSRIISVKSRTGVNV